MDLSPYHLNYTLCCSAFCLVECHLQGYKQRAMFLAGQEYDETG